jgi:small-conductance mechanosensitive channel
MSIDSVSFKTAIQLPMEIALLQTSVDWFSSWPPPLRGVFLLFALIAAAELAHFLLYACLRRAQEWRPNVMGGLFIRYTSSPAHLLFLLFSLTFALAHIRVPRWEAGLIQQALEVAYIVASTWLAIGLLEIVHAFLVARLPADIEDDVRARRIRTQIYLLRQILIWLLVFIGFAAILMTFPSIRNVGAGLFASAGVAGLVLGMAARPTLGNLIAGIQIALTEPIRIDDAVVVEGESGRVVEVNTTYVVIRLWDLRHMIVPISHFIEKSFENWTRYSSEMIGAVHLQTDYTVPVERLREQYQIVLQSTPLWNGKTNVVQVTDSRDGAIEIRFLMSAASSTAVFDLRCYVREKMLDYLQREHPSALPKVRSEVAVSGAIRSAG